MGVQLSVELYMPGVGSQVYRYDLDAPVMKSLDDARPLATIAVGEPGQPGFQIQITKALIQAAVPAPVEAEIEKKYKVEGNCVYKENADGSLGDKLKCYEGEKGPEQAAAYARALYANVPDASKARPDSTKPAKGQAVHTAEGDKLNIEDTTHIADAITALEPGGFRGREVQLTPAERKTAIGKIRAAIGKIADKKLKEHLLQRLAEVEGGKSLERPGGFVVKMVAGEYRWFGRPSLNIEDRENEAASKAFLEKLVQQEKARGRYPRLEFFHTNVPVGYTDDFRVVNGILVATGGFNRDPASQAIAKGYAEHPDGVDGSGWAMSWRFFASPDADGVYRRVTPKTRIREFTFLPTSQAALPVTKFDLKEVA